MKEESHSKMVWAGFESCYLRRIDVAWELHVRARDLLIFAFVLGQVEGCRKARRGGYPKS